MLCGRTLIGLGQSHAKAPVSREMAGPASRSAHALALFCFLMPTASVVRAVEHSLKTYLCVLHFFLKPRKQTLAMYPLQDIAKTVQTVHFNTLFKTNSVTL